MFDCSPLLSLQLCETLCSLVSLIGVPLRISLLDRRKLVSSVSIEAEANDADLIEGVILVDMIGPHDKPDKLSLERHVDLLQLSCRIVCVRVGVKRCPSQLFPVFMF